MRARTVRMLKVWVKVDDQEETLVARNGKGGRQMTVELSKTYLYRLTDAGEQLATVTVKANNNSQAPPPASGGMSARTPMIRASPQNVTISGATGKGSTNLLWEAGADHASAEVRVQVNGGDETLFAKSAKGGRRVQVELGKTYVYTLTDGSEELATVTVKGGGKSQPPPPASGSTSSKTPIILANPPVVLITALQRVGTTTVIWEAGPAHPSAEVWVQINGGSETLLAKDAKGGR